MGPCCITYVDEQHNQRIEEIANIMIHDGVSPDEQEDSKLQKYKIRAMSDYMLKDKEAMQIVYEALLYRKLKSTDTSRDPLQKGNEFGAGFS